MKLGFLAQVPPVSLSLSLRLKFTFGEFSRVDTICKNKGHVHLRSHSWYRKRRAAWIGAMCRVTGRRVRKKTLALMFPKSTDDFEVCRKPGSDFLFTYPKPCYHDEGERAEQLLRRDPRTVLQSVSASWNDHSFTLRNSPSWRPVSFLPTLNHFN